MDIKRLARWRHALEAWFPERHLYVRSGGEIRTFVLTTSRQLMIAGAVAALLGWTGVATGALVLGGLVKTSADQEIARNQGKYERWIADREARLDSAVAQLSNANGAVDALASSTAFGAQPDLVAAIDGLEPVPAGLVVLWRDLLELRLADRDRAAIERLLARSG